MSLRDIVGLVANGKLHDAEEMLVSELDNRRDDLLEIGRDHIASSVVATDMGGE